MLLTELSELYWEQESICSDHTAWPRIFLSLKRKLFLFLSVCG